jgi:hypothetical protein
MRPRRPSPQALLALATLLILAGLLPYALAQRPAPGEEGVDPIEEAQEQSEPAPAIDSLVSIALPQSQLVVQNLESDRPIDLEIDLRRADGSTASHLRFEGVPPLSPRVVTLAELPELPVGIYSASVNGTGKVAALARHAWPLPGDGDREDLAISTASEPALDLVVPYLAISGTAESAVLSVQNTDPVAAASVDIALIPFAVEGAAPAWEGQIELAAGGSASLDLAGPGFDSLDRGFRGFARIRADRPVAAAGLIVLGGGSEKAAAALEAMPALSAGDRIAGAFGTGSRSRPPIASVLVNPGDSAVDVEMTYHPLGPLATACGSGPMPGPRLRLSAESAEIVSPRPGVETGFSENCSGLVAVDVQGGKVLMAHIELSAMNSEEASWQPRAATSAAGTAPGKRLAFPWISWQKEDFSGKLAGRSSFGLVLNPQNTSTWARLEARSDPGRLARLPTDSQISVPALDFGVWSLSSVSGSSGDTTFEGSGWVEAGEALLGLLRESAAAGDAIYDAVEVENAGPMAQLPFLARPPIWPTRPIIYTQAPDPTASPTRVTVLPPVPRAEPTLVPPARLNSFAPPVRDAWRSCCAALAWTMGGELWGVEWGDGVGLGVSRFEPATGRRLGGLPELTFARSMAVWPEGDVSVLEREQGFRILRFDELGRAKAEIALPAERSWDLRDMAVAPDGGIWLIDNEGLEVHQLGSSGDYQASWAFHDALRSWGDGGYRIAFSPDGESVWILTWARLLRFSTEGRLLTAVGAPRFELGSEDFKAPMDLAVDAFGRAYVLEGTGRLRVFEPDGWEVANWQAFDWTVEEGDWNETALALGPEGQVAVTDLTRIHIFAPLGGGATTGPTATHGPFRGFLPFARSRD